MTGSDGGSPSRKCYCSLFHEIANPFQSADKIFELLHLKTFVDS
jgi:hypothetical protein